jgi:DNA-binding NarL/FixJ family response regulator
LRALVRKLPRDQVEVIVLSFYGELSHGEIATQLGLPLGTVKGRMRLGLEKLRIEAVARETAPRTQHVHPSKLPEVRLRSRRRPQAPEALCRDSRQ